MTAAPADASPTLKEGRTWAFRLIDFGDHVALHEVHFERGRIVAYTDAPAYFAADPGCAGEIAEELVRALDAARNVPPILKADLPG